jgi:hypothetical protein
MYLENWLYNLWPHHHFQYNTRFYFGFTYKNFKLLHMCLNFENTINRNININIKIENDKIKSNLQVWIIPFFIEFHKQKFHLCTSNLHYTIYGIIIINKTNYFLGFAYIFKLLHKCLNFEHKINKKKKMYASQ